jgi:hypothetical protein
MTHLERAERRMRRCWYELALAESRAESAEVLHQRYEQYLAALHAYCAAFEARVGVDQEQMAS